MSWVISPAYKDPNYSNVSLLLHGDGANNGVVFTDNSPSPKTFTTPGVGNNIKTVTGVTDPFGRTTSGVLALDGNNDYLLSSSSSDLAFGTGDFTIECWTYLTSISIYATPVCIGDYKIAGLSMYTQGGTLRVFCDSVLALNTGSGIVTGRWHHLAISRSGTTLRGFIDGVAGSTTGTLSTNITQDVARIGVGFYNGVLDQGAVNGYIDDVRITKGFCRYTNSFTPPTAPFPDA